MNEKMEFKQIHNTPPGQIHNGNPPCAIPSPLPILLPYSCFLNSSSAEEVGAAFVVDSSVRRFTSSSI